MIVCAVITALLLVVGGLWGRWSPFYARELQKPLQSFGALEGLRGFLAIIVYFSHMELTRQLVNTGEWATESQFHLYLGRAGVACFFMITALLFWTKILAADGKLDYVSLYVSRFRRIVPMYEFSVACLLVGVAWSSHFELRVPARELVETVAQWAAFSACGFPDVNGVPQTMLIGAGVFWTLTYEWAFYVSLPVLAVFRKPTLFPLMILGGYFAFVEIGHFRVAIYFFIGMIVAMALRMKPPSAWVRHPVAGLLAVGSVSLSFATFHNNHLGMIGALSLGLFFYIVASGNTLGGVLVSRPARVLGMISYSLYVMQGLVLFAMRHVISIESASPQRIWLFDALGGVVLVVVSLATYQWIEYPFMKRRAVQQPAQAPPSERVEAAATLEPRPMA